MNTKIKVILAFVTLFVMGFASGYLFHSALTPEVGEVRLERVDQAEDPERGQRGVSGERSGRQSERMRNRFSNLLDLNSEQEEVFFEQMAEYRSGIRREVREMRGREHEMVILQYEAFRNDLSGILNPGQLEKLDTYLHPDSVQTQRMRGPGQRGREAQRN